MKRLLLALPVLLVTLLAVLLVAPAFIDWDKYKPQAQDQIKKLTGLDVNINGDVGFALLPSPRFSAENVVVDAPEGSSRDTLMSLERLEVSVALAPLLSGEVNISALDLVKPQIAVEVLKNGKQNWQTPEIEALRAKGKTEVQPRKNNLIRGVSLEDISIENGVFDYLNTPVNRVTSLQDIDLEIKAETLQGPFELEGDALVGGRAVEFEAQTGKIEPGAESVSLKGKAGIEAQGLTLEYAGIATVSGPLQIQGETSARLSPLSASAPGLKFEPDSAVVKGILTASADKFDLKNASIAAGGQQFTGALSGTVSPLSLKGQLKGSEIVNLDKYIAAGSGPGFDPAQPGAFLPRSMALPVPFEADLRLTLPGIIYKKQVYSAVDLDLVKKGSAFEAKFAAGDVPGKGALQGQAGLKFSNRTVSKTGGETFTAPTLNVSLKGRTQNAAQTLQALSGSEPPAGLMKAAQFDIAAAVTPARLQVQSSTVTLDERNYALSGTLENKAVDATIGAMGGQLNVKGTLEGKALKEMQVQAKHQNLAEALQTLSGAKQRNKLLEKPVDFSARVNQDGKVYKLQDIKATLGQDAITGSATWDMSAAKPVLNAALKFEDLMLQPGEGGAGGRWSQAAIDTGWMHVMNADLDIAAKSIKYKTWDLSNPVIKASLKDGVLDIKQMDSGLYGGSASVTGTVNGAASPLSVKGQAKLRDVSVEQLVKSFTGNRVIKGSGQVNFETQISGAGASQAALVSSLQGPGTVTGSKLVMEGFDLSRFARALSEETRPGDTVLGLWKGTIKGGSTAFDTLDGAFTLNKGVANITKLDLDGPQVLVNTTGNVSLPAWTVQTAHKITVKDRKDVPPFTVNINGPLDNPVQTFAEGALRDYLSRKVTRKLEDMITEKVGEKLGIPLLPQAAKQAPVQVQQAPVETPQQAAPAEASPPAEQPQQKAPAAPPATPEEAFEGLLKGLIQEQ